jgi:hypothetical protein
VAVYIGRTDRPVPERQKLIADVSRAVVAHWDSTQPAPPLVTATSTPTPAAAAGAGATTPAP